MRAAGAERALLLSQAAAGHRAARLRRLGLRFARNDDIDCGDWKAVGCEHPTLAEAAAGHFAGVGAEAGG